MTTISPRRCAACHDVRRIRVTGALSGWERVHELPRGVRFSHRRHRHAQCRICHGPVEQRDLATEDFPLDMAFCRDCHAAEGAKTGCGTCHRVR